MKIHKFGLLVAIALFCGTAFAERDPEAGAEDQRIKVVEFSPNDVIAIRVSPLRATVIELPDGEVAVDAKIGDKASFILEATGDNRRIALKPKKDVAKTNLILVGSERMYVFELEVDRERADYLVRFAEEEDLSAELAWKASPAGRVEAHRKAEDSGVMVAADALNLDYTWSGAERLRPVRVFDDGEMTFFQFDGRQALPAIFAVGPNGEEAIVEFSVEGEYVVVHGIEAQFALRYGDTMTCIFNERYALVPMVAAR